MNPRHFPDINTSQQYKDVKEKVEQLVPLLTKLKETLTTVTPGVDPEEEKRRKDLSR